GVALGLRFERTGCVTYCRVRHAHAPVEPRAAAETTDDRDRDRLRDPGPRHRTGAREIDERGAASLQTLRFVDEAPGHLFRNLDRAAQNPGVLDAEFAGVALRDAHLREY